MSHKEEEARISQGELKKKGRLGDLENDPAGPSNLSSQEKGPVILTILDASFNGEAPKVVLQVHQYDDFASTVCHIPSQDEGTGRIYNYTPPFWTDSEQAQRN